MKNNKTSFKNRVKEIFSDIYNKQFFRKGGYAFIITVLVLAAIILFNVIVSVLSKKVNLEFDMTSNNTNSISEENEKFIKSVNSNVSVIVCAAKEEYSTFMVSYAESSYNTSANQLYFAQTIKLLDKYNSLNNKISVYYADMQSTEFAAINQKYASLNLAYGDILVISEDESKVKHLSFNDIYPLYDPSGYASYGYDSYSIKGNNLENVLSGAISYCISEKIYKIGLITGHSNNNCHTYYANLLKDNNYETEEVSDSVITSLSDDFDAVAILAPTNDFASNEIDVISKFLNTEGKSLIFFGDAGSPKLPNLYELLSEWGIEIKEGILFETYEKALPNANIRSALVTLPTGESKITENIDGFITGYNIALNVKEPADTSITAIGLTTTFDTVINAPVGSPDDYSNYTEDQLAAYSGSILAQKQLTNGKSSVLAFGSIEYIDSDWAENKSLKNKDFVLAATNNVCGADENGFAFVAKQYTTEDFSDKIGTAASQRVNRVFVYYIPIILLATGIFIYIRRRHKK